MSFLEPTSLESCLKAFTKEEILDGDDKPVSVCILSMYTKAFLFIYPNTTIFS